MKRVFLSTVVSAAFVAAAPLAYAQADEASIEATAVVAQATVEDVGATAAQGPQRAAAQQRAFRMPSERVEARLAYIRTALKITDAQQSQWEGFASVLRKQAGEMDQRIAQFRAQRGEGAKPRGEMRRANAIERMERNQKRMEARARHMNEVLAAARPLYAALSPEQQQVADQLISQRGGRHGQRGGHRGMHRPGFQRG